LIVGLGVTITRYFHTLLSLTTTITITSTAAAAATADDVGKLNPHFSELSYAF
jgi:hypothetical protein